MFGCTQHGQQIVSPVALIVIDHIHEADSLTEDYFAGTTWRTWVLAPSAKLSVKSELVVYDSGRFPQEEYSELDGCPSLVENGMIIIAIALCNTIDISQVVELHIQPQS